MMDLKVPKKTTQAQINAVEVGDYEEPDYPYGLKLRFETEQIEQMPALKVFKDGNKITLSAEGTVVMSRTESKGGKEERCLEIQLEKVACAPKELKPPEKMNPTEYKQAREGKLV